MAQRRAKKGLRPKHQLFVDAYLKDPNATKAAIAAGYSEDSAHVAGSRLLKNANVTEAIESRLARASEKVDVTVEYVLAGLKREAEEYGEQASHSARVSALGLLGKYKSMFTERVEVSGKLSLEQLVTGAMGGEE